MRAAAVFEPKDMNIAGHRVRMVYLEAEHTVVRQERGVPSVMVYDAPGVDPIERLTSIERVDLCRWGGPAAPDATEIKIVRALGGDHPHVRPEPFEGLDDGAAFPVAEVEDGDGVRPGLNDADGGVEGEHGRLTTSPSPPTCPTSSA